MFSRRPTVLRFNRAFRAARAEGRDLGDIPARAHGHATECGCKAGGLAGVIAILAAVPVLILADNRLLVAALVLPALLAAVGIAKAGAIAVAHWRLARLCRRVEESIGRPHRPAPAAGQAPEGDFAL